MTINADGNRLAKSSAARRTICACWRRASATKTSRWVFKCTIRCLSDFRSNTPTVKVLWTVSHHGNNKRLLTWLLVHPKTSSPQYEGFRTATNGDFQAALVARNRKQLLFGNHENELDGQSKREASFDDCIRWPYTVAAIVSSNHWFVRKMALAFQPTLGSALREIKTTAEQLKRQTMEKSTQTMTSCSKMEHFWLNFRIQTNVERHDRHFARIERACFEDSVQLSSLLLVVSRKVHQEGSNNSHKKYQPETLEKHRVWPTDEWNDASSPTPPRHRSAKFEIAEKFCFVTHGAKSFSQPRNSHAQLLMLILS